MPLSLGPDGLQIQTADEIKADLVSGFQASFGNTIQADNPNAVVGNIVAILAVELLAFQEGLDGVYQSAFLDGAAGVNLDRLVQLIGLTRNVATPTTVAVSIANSNAAPVAVPQGALVQVQATGDVFAVVAAVVVPGLGSIAAELRAVNTGPTAIAALTTWQIVTPFAGSNFLTVTNAAAGTAGTDEETDAALRLRALFSAHLPGKGTVQAIRAAIADLSGVTEVQVFENTGLLPGITTPVAIALLPGKSFVAAVRGGVAADIAAVIFAQKPTGIGTFGATTINVADDQGFLHPISFEPATALTIFVEITITNGSASFAAAIEAAVVAYVDSLTVGQKVVAAKVLAAATDAAGTIDNCTAKIDTVFPPVATGNLAVPWNQYASLTLANITVVFV